MDEPCILVVESDVLIRQPLAEYLRECGYKVIEALNPGEARQLLAERHASIDIVLVDVDAPGENGFALAQWIRTNNPDIAIILAGTIAATTEKASELCEDGPTLAKPYDHRFLLDRIRSLLAGRKSARRMD